MGAQKYKKGQGEPEKRKSNEYWLQGPIITCCKIIKNREFGFKKYNNRNEKFTRRTQQQI